MQNTKKIFIIAVLIIIGLLIAYTGFLLYWQKNFSPSADDISESPTPVESSVPETSPTPPEVSPTPPEVSPTPPEVSPTPPPASGNRRKLTPTPTPTPTPTLETQPIQEQINVNENTNTNEEEVSVAEEVEEEIVTTLPVSSPTPTLTPQIVLSPSTNKQLSKLDLPIAPENVNPSQTAIAGFAILPRYTYLIYIIIPVIITIGLYYYKKRKDKANIDKK